MHNFLDVTYAAGVSYMVLGLVAFGHLYSKRRPKHPPHLSTSHISTFFLNSQNPFILLQLCVEKGFSWWTFKNKERLCWWFSMSYSMPFPIETGFTLACDVTFIPNDWRFANSVKWTSSVIAVWVTFSILLFFFCHQNWLKTQRSNH